MGGTLPDGVTPLITYGDNVYRFTASVGKGVLAVIGDAGLVSNGLLCFPGYDNAAFAKDVFRRVTPAWCETSARRWDLTPYFHISSSPSPRGLNEEILRNLRPNAKWEVDRHYRHLTWEGEVLRAADEAVWERLPVPLTQLKAASVKTMLPAIRYDADEPGTPIPIELHIEERAGAGRRDIVVMGRARSQNLTWKDLSQDAERFKPAGDVEQVNTVFRMTVVFDGAGKPFGARWNQGQFLYARNKASWRYGYEIILASASGAIAPRVE